MGDSAIIVTQLVTLATVIIGFLVALYRERRNRQWDLEDREHARQETIRRQERARIESEERHNKIGEKLNAILRRNEEMGIPIPEEIRSLVEKLDETPAKVEEVKEKVIEIDEKVSEIKEKISDEPSIDKSRRPKKGNHS